MAQLVAQAESTTPRVQGTGGAPTRVRRLLRRAIHFLSYKFILNRRSTRFVRAAGFRLVVRPTVFHPRYFIASEYFAGFIGGLDLSKARVVDVGTGTGIIALAAARAGARSVLAVDINPNAALSASENAAAHGLAVSVVCGDLLSALSPDARFDVICSNPPFFPEEPLDVADRAWHAGPGYRDIKALFEQARARLAPDGRFFILLSSDCDLTLLHDLIEQAQFRAREIARKSLVIETLIMYELRPN